MTIVMGLSKDDAVNLVDPTAQSLILDKIKGEISDEVATALLGEGITRVLGFSESFIEIESYVAAGTYDYYYGKAGIDAVKKGAPTYLTITDTVAAGIGAPWQFVGLGAELSVQSHGRVSTVNGKPVV